MRELTTTVILCTRNRSDDILTCLGSLVQQRKISDELIVVDSSDVPLEKMSSFSSNFLKRPFLKHR